MIEVKKIKTELKKKLSGKNPDEESSGSGICCCFVPLGKIDSKSPSIGIKCFDDPYDARNTFRFHSYLSQHPRFKNKVPKVFGKLFKIGDETCYAVEEVYIGMRRVPRALKVKIRAKHGKSISNAKDALADEIRCALIEKFPHHKSHISSFMADRHDGNYGFRSRYPYIVWVDFSI